MGRLLTFGNSGMKILKIRMTEAKYKLFYYQMMNTEICMRGISFLRKLTCHKLLEN